MAEQSLKDKTAKGIFWGGISNGLQQVLNLIFGIVLARILDVSDYGMVGMLAIFSAIASSIQECGFTTALTNEKEIKHEDYNAVFWFSVISGVIMYFILFFSAPLIADFYKTPELKNISRVLFLSFVFGGIGTAQYAYMFKTLMVKQQAKVNVLALFFSGIAGIVSTLMGFAYWGLITQSLIYVALSTLLRWYYSPWRPTLNFNFFPLKRMIGFSSKIFFSNIFLQISNNIFSVLLGKLYNANQVGFYSQGQKWMGMGQLFIGSVINNVAQPILVQVSNEKERQKEVFRKMVRFGAFLSFPLMFGLAFVSKEFIIIAIGIKWEPAVPFLRAFCIWGAFAYLWILFNNLLMTYGKSNICMWVTISTCSLQMLALLIMLPYGILSMLGAYIIAYFVGLFVQYYFVRKLISLSVFNLIKDISPYLLATFVSFAIVWFSINPIDNIYTLFISKILLSGFIYCAILWFGNSIIFKESVQYIRKRR